MPSVAMKAGIARSVSEPLISPASAPTARPATIGINTGRSVKAG